MIFSSLYSGAKRFLSKFAQDRAFGKFAGVIDILFGESPAKALAEHRKISRLFLTKQTKPLVQCFPKLPGKYFRNYLSRNFSKKSRREGLLHHYEFLAARTNDDFYADIIGRRCILWQKKTDRDLYEIALTFHERGHHESDLSLIFQNEGVSVFELSFAVVPGHLVGVEASDAIFIGRVQGTARQATIRAAAKLCNEVSPAHMLMVAVQAAAAALGINVMAGVNTRNQIGKEGGGIEHVFDYDAFWQTLLAKRNSRDFFIMPVPLPEKPMELITKNRRGQGKRRAKREFKRQVGAAIEQTFADRFLTH